MKILQVEQYDSERTKQIIDDFHKLYYGGRVHYNDKFKPASETTWMGTRAQKLPFDLMVLQEILWDCKPDIIVECGSSAGGTSLFLGCICEMIRHGQVITIDIQTYHHPTHPAVSWVTGDVFHPDLLAELQKAHDNDKTMMVILDDDHVKDHVLQEMEVYGKLVTPGQYMVVEDSNINGHPVWPDFGPGPYEAIHEFIPNHPEFKIDKNREHYALTFHPDGFLLRLPDAKS